jgi:hypothetical protein
MRPFLFLVLLVPALAFAQGDDKKKPYKFEAISAEMLQRRAYPIDSSARTIVLADVGECYIESNNKHSLTLTMHRHKRIHFLGKGDFSEATFQVFLFHGSASSSDELEGLKAVSYNLENGKVTETRLPKGDVFTEKKTRNLDIKKFTLPSVREGTIIDVEYKYTTESIAIPAWAFQGNNPTLWSDYTVAIPQFFEYMFLAKGNLPLYINEQKKRNQLYDFGHPDFTAEKGMQFYTDVVEHHWVMKDVPGFRMDGFLSSPYNYLNRIEFQLAAVKDPLPYRNMIPTWGQKIEELLRDDHFGHKLDKENPYLNEVMKDLKTGTQLEQARKIFDYVHSHIKCTGEPGIYLDQTVKEVFQSGKGTIPETNLLLVTMLRNAGMDAAPVVLSTREHGKVESAYPMLNRFNYLVVMLRIDGEVTYLDASQPRIGFGHLPARCYNGLSTVVDEFARIVDLSANSLQEKKLTAVLLNDITSTSIRGTFQQVPGYYESERLRSLLQDKGKDALAKELWKDLPTQVKCSALQVDSSSRYEYPLGLKANVEVDLSGDDVIFINPMMGEAQKENPFKSTDRNYPVEMPYTQDETYMLTLFVPDGYTVDELPKPARIYLNEKKEGSFEYAVGLDNGMISIRSSVRFSRANFEPEEYEALREFVNVIVAKHREQIVLKKKK